MRRFTHLVVLAAFVFSCGGQWYALQGIAWIKMIHDYSRMASLTEAVSMTFSGHYPCEICKALAEKEKSENDKACSIDKSEKKIFQSAWVQVHPAAVEPVGYPSRETRLNSRTEAPPVPPPRLALA